MRNTTCFWAVLIFLLFSTACNKEKDQSNESDKHEVVYFTLWRFETVGADFIPFSWFAAYDIDDAKFIWQKKDQNPYTRGGYYRVGKGGSYFETFSSGNTLVRIYATEGKATTVTLPYAGVVMVKSDPSNGNTILSKIIVNGAELPISTVDDRYAVSNVIQYNDKFIFGCTNGKIYCVDNTGNTIWTYGYKPYKQNLGQFFLHLKGDKIFFLERGTNELQRVCINAENGNLLWKVYAAKPKLEEMYITSKYIFSFDDGLYPSHNDVNTGKLLGTFATVGSNGYDPIPFGSSNPNYGYYVMTATDNGVGVLNAEDPNMGYTLSDGFLKNYFRSDAFEFEGYLYGLSSGPTDRVLTCFDPATGKIKWQLGDSTTFFGPYAKKNGKLYFFTNFHKHENGQYFTTTDTQLITIDAKTGQILKAANNVDMINTDYWFGALAK